MKTNQIIGRVLLIVVALLLVLSCSKDENQEIEKVYENFAIVDLTTIPESDFDVLVLSKDKTDFIAVKGRSENLEIPEIVVYKDGISGNESTIFFDKKGNLDKVMINNYTLIFENFNGNKVDIGVLSPTGEIKVFRDIETTFNWESTYVAKNVKLISSVDWKMNLLAWVSDRIDAIPCAMAVIQTLEGNVFGAMQSGFDCGLNIGERLGEALRENGYRIYVSQEFYDNFNTIFEFYDSASAAFACFKFDSEFLDCIFSVLNLIDNLVIDKYLQIDDNSSEIDEIYYLLSLEDFKSDFFDLNDNKVPEGWQHKAYGNPGSDISDGRLNAYITDGRGDLIKESSVSTSTTEIVLEMDAMMVYSYWGNVNFFNIFYGNKMLQFRTGEEDYDHPEGYLANGVIYKDGSDWSYIHESLSARIEGVYHLKLVMNDSGYEFSGKEPNGNESFNIIINSNDSFNFRDIDKISFAVNSTTDNSGWIDNLRITVKE